MTVEPDKNSVVEPLLRYLMRDQDPHLYNLWRELDETRSQKNHGERPVDSLSYAELCEGEAQLPEDFGQLLKRPMKEWSAADRKIVRDYYPLGSASRPQGSHGRSSAKRSASSSAAICGGERRPPSSSGMPWAGSPARRSARCSRA